MPNVFKKILTIRVLIVKHMETRISTPDVRPLGPQSIPSQLLVLARVRREQPPADLKGCAAASVAPSFARRLQSKSASSQKSLSRPLSFISLSSVTRSSQFLENG